MPERDRPLVDRGGERPFVVDYEAGDLGAEVRVSCLRCGGNIGDVPERAHEELLCQRCGIVYDVRGLGQGVTVREVRRIPIIEDTGLPSPGQVLSRPDIEIDIGWRRRVIMVAWGMLMAGAMMLGLWAVVRFYR